MTRESNPMFFGQPISMVQIPWQEKSFPRVLRYNDKGLRAEGLSPPKRLITNSPTHRAFCPVFPCHPDPPNHPTIPLPFAFLPACPHPSISISIYPSPLSTKAKLIAEGNGPHNPLLSGQSYPVFSHRVPRLPAPCSMLFGAPVDIRKHLTYNPITYQAC